MVEHAKRLAELMKKRGWNQVMVSKRSGLSQVQVSHILSGRRFRLRMETVEKLAAAFGLTVDQYMGKSEKKEPDPLTQQFAKMLEGIPENDPILKVIEDIILGEKARRKTKS